MFDRERGREREEGKMHLSYKQNCLSIHIIKMKIFNYISHRCEAK